MYSKQLLSLLRRIGAEIEQEFSPATFNGDLAIGSQHDFDAAIAQARLDLRQAVIKGEPLESAYKQARDNLRLYVAKKNERYKRDYMLQRWSEHGQDKLTSDYSTYTRAASP